MSTQGQENGSATPKKNTAKSEQAQPLEESPRENSAENVEMNLSFEDNNQNDGEQKDEQITKDQKESDPKTPQDTQKAGDKKGNEQEVGGKDGNSNQGAKENSSQNEQSKNKIQKQENQKPSQEQKQSEQPQKQLPNTQQQQPQGKQALEDNSKAPRATLEQKSNEEDPKQILFFQLLGEMLDVHQTSQAVYEAIDQKGKGFIQQEDLAKELVDSFGIEDEEKQAEIFQQLSKGAKQVSRKEFEEIFKKIEEERKQQEEEDSRQEEEQKEVNQTPEKLVEKKVNQPTQASQQSQQQNRQPNSSSNQNDNSQKSQNQQGKSAQSKQQQQSQKPSKEEKQTKPQQQQQQRQLPQSPFKNQQKRDEMINIFEGEVDLEKANNTQHFTEDSKYAPVIRKLRQQPNFEDFVRSYNQLQFPKNSEDSIYISPNSSYQQPYNQQQQFQYNPFSQVSAEHQNKLAHRFELFANTAAAAPAIQSSSKGSFISVSPVRKVKTTNLNVSPPQGLFDSFEKNTKDWKKDKNLEFVPKKTNIKVQDSYGGSQKQPKYGRFLSPQQNRNIQSQQQGTTFFGKESFVSNNSQVLGGNSRSSNGFLTNNAKNFQTNSLYLPLKDFNEEPKNNIWNSQLSSNQSRQFGLPRNYQNMNMFAGDLASPKLSQSNYFQSPKQEQNSLFLSRGENQYYQEQQQLTPNHKRLNRLKRQVGIGLDGLKAIHKNEFIPQQRLPSPEQGQQTRQMKEQFKQYLSSQLGMVSSPQQQQQPGNQTRGTSGQFQQSAQEDIFGDIMQKIQGGRAPIIAQDRTRKAALNMDSLGGNQRSGSPYGNSISPKGVHGQMERVKKIQAALRAPLKKKIKFDGISKVSPGRQERGTSKTQKRSFKEEEKVEKKRNSKIDWPERNTSKTGRNK